MCSVGLILLDDWPFHQCNMLLRSEITNKKNVGRFWDVTIGNLYWGSNPPWFILFH
jgi:hypothetical protein